MSVLKKSLKIFSDDKERIKESFNNNISGLMSNDITIEPCFKIDGAFVIEFKYRDDTYTSTYKYHDDNLHFIRCSHFDKDAVEYIENIIHNL